MLEIRLMPGDLQHRHMTHQVGLHIGERIFQRIPHPRLGGEVDDAFDVPVILHHRLHGIVIGDIDFMEGKAVAALETGQTGLLEAHVVIVVHIVDADNLLAAGQ